MNDEETVADLLRQAMFATGTDSGRGLEEVARRRGLSLSHTQINGLLNGSYRYARRQPAIEAIAELANVDISRAYRAAGMPMPRRPFAEELHADADYLEPAEREAINELIRLLTAGRRTLVPLRDVEAGLVPGGSFARRTPTQPVENVDEQLAARRGRSRSRDEAAQQDRDLHGPQD